MNTKTINIQVLALLGDAVLSLYIREQLLKKGINNANKLQELSIAYVSAKGEVKILKKLIENNILTEEEIDIIKRGRNNKKENHPKNTDILTYKLSTGFEALLGELYLNNKERLKEILNLIEVE
ncbi:MAG: Mini-ribonuclease 3 [Bacilli bacterium]